MSRVLLVSIVAREQSRRLRRVKFRFLPRSGWQEAMGRLYLTSACYVYLCREDLFTKSIFNYLKWLKAAIVTQKPLLALVVSLFRSTTRLSSDNPSHWLETTISLAHGMTFQLDA
jgi:hypothetical protein